MTEDSDRRDRDLASTLAHVRRAQQGNDSAWDRLAMKVDDELRPWLRGTQLPPGRDGDDLIQIVLLEVFRTIDRFTVDADAQFRPWVRRIAKHRLIDMWRRQRVREKHAPEVPIDLGNPDAGDVDIEDAQAATPSCIVRADEAAARIAEIETGLNERHRRALELREADGLDYDQIATAIGLPSGEQARYLYHYARKRRAELMRSYFDSTIAKPPA